MCDVWCDSFVRATQRLAHQWVILICLHTHIHTHTHMYISTHTCMCICIEDTRPVQPFSHSHGFPENQKVCNMTHLYVQYDALTCVTWLIHISKYTRMSCASRRNITNKCVWQDSVMCVTWLFRRRMRDMTSHMRERWRLTYPQTKPDIKKINKKKINKTQCHFPRAQRWVCSCRVWHDFIRMRDVICATWLICSKYVATQDCENIRDMTHSCMRHDLFADAFKSWFKCATWLIGRWPLATQRRKKICVTLLTHVCDMTGSQTNACLDFIQLCDVTLR